MSSRRTYYYFFITALLAQVLILDNMSIGTRCFPIVYTACIIFMPLDTHPFKALVTSLIVAMVCDVSMGVCCLNIIATLPIAFFRRQIIGSIAGYDIPINDTGIPTVKKMGMMKFNRYVIAMVSIHSVLFFVFEWFSFDNFLFFLTRLIFSTVISLCLIYLLLYLFRKH